MLFQIGDCLAAAVIGVATALIVRVIISPGMDMVIAMLIGMGLAFRMRPEQKFEFDGAVTVVPA